MKEAKVVQKLSLLACNNNCVLQLFDKRDTIQPELVAGMIRQLDKRIVCLCVSEKLGSQATNQCKCGAFFGMNTMIIKFK